MFATDDITQKIMIVNVLPPGQCAEAIDAIFLTKAQRKKLKDLAETRLGAARVRPFRNMKEEEKIATVKGILDKECEALKKMCIDN